MGDANQYKLTEHKEPIYSPDDVIDLLLAVGIDKMVDHHLVVDDDHEVLKLETYNDLLLKRHYKLVTEEQSTKITMDDRVNTWFSILDPYRGIDVLSWSLDKCETDIQRQRVRDEFQLYEKYDKVVVLHLCMMLVDHFRKIGVVWGVGRGSCVSSYILYLIGIHRVDSIKYNLDFNDMFKEER